MWVQGLTLKQGRGARVYDLVLEMGLVQPSNPACTEFLGGYLGLAASTRPLPVTALARLFVGFMSASLRLVSWNSICDV